MVLVMGTISVVLVLIAVSASVTINALRISRSHVTYEQAIAAAESGVDYALARLQRAWDTQGADYPIPSGANAVDPAPEWAAASITTPYPAGTFPDRTTEQAWAETQLLNVVTVSGCLHEGALGEFVVEGLPPGDYYAAAIPAAEVDEDDPSVFAVLAHSAEAVRLDEGTKTHVHLRTVSRR